VLFDHDPQLMGQLLRDDCFTEAAARMVARLSTRSILSGEVQKIFKSASIPDGFGLTDRQNQRLRSSYQRMMLSKDFFQHLFGVAGDAFVPRTFVVSGAQNVDQKPVACFFGDASFAPRFL
jgi:hypothetical protein